MQAYRYHLKEVPADQWEQEVERCAALFEMKAHLDQRVWTYAGGTQQRLLLVQAALVSILPVSILVLALCVVQPAEVC